MQKGAAALFLLIAGLLIIGLASVLLFNLMKASSLQAFKSSFRVPVSTPAPQTYTNQKLGLTFQYPNTGFQIKEDSEEEYNKRGNGNFRKNFTGYVAYEPGKVLGAVVVLDKDQDFEANPFSIWVFDNSDNLTADQWFDKYWYYPFLWGVFDWTSKGHIAPDQEATISGQTTKYKIVSYQPGLPKYLYLSNQGRMYLLRLIGEAGDQVLSSFEFLK